MANTDDDSDSIDKENDRGRDKPAIAVAVADDPTSGQAPSIIAKGTGAVAEQILQIAFDHGVKVREDADLAELLVAVDVESEIPLEALAAVAEILSYVYRANNAVAPPPGGADGREPSS